LHLVLFPFPTRRSSDLPHNGTVSVASAHGRLYGPQLRVLQFPFPNVVMIAPNITGANIFSPIFARQHRTPGYHYGRDIHTTGSQDRKSTRLNSSHVKIS